MFHDEKIRKLSAFAVIDWSSLSVKDNGHTTKIPNFLGENLWITSIIKDGEMALS